MPLHQFIVRCAMAGDGLPDGIGPSVFSATRETFLGYLQVAGLRVLLVFSGGITALDLVGSAVDSKLAEVGMQVNLAVLRKAMAALPPIEAMEKLIENLQATKTNAELLLSGLR